MCLVVATLSCNVYAGPVVENFDWGLGVPGRETITAGAPVDNVRVQSGDVVLKDSGVVRSVFAGESGPGRGALEMKGANNVVGFTHALSGVTVVTASGKFYPGNTTRGIRGFWLGVQTAKPDNKLLNNQKTDHLVVQVGSSGAIIFRSVVGGVTNQSAGIKGTIEFKPGDLVKMELTVNMIEKTASVKVTGAGKDNEKVRTVKWTSEKAPAWDTVIINQTGEGQVLLDSLEAREEFIILG
jgi:hypothetical protein